MACSLVLGAPCQLRLLAGQEHSRTIPLGDHRGRLPPRAIAPRRTAGRDERFLGNCPRTAYFGLQGQEAFSSEGLSRTRIAGWLPVRAQKNASKQNADLGF